MAKKTFFVDPNRQLNHDGLVVNGGDPIELDDSKEAVKALLEQGVILIDKPEEVLKADLADLQQTVADQAAEIAELKKKLENTTKK